MSVLEAVFSIDGRSIQIGKQPALCLGEMQVDGPRLATGSQSFLISSIWVCGWCFGGSCSSATSAVAKASVMPHPSWPVIPFR